MPAEFHSWANFREYINENNSPHHFARQSSAVIIVYLSCNLKHHVSITKQKESLFKKDLEPDLDLDPVKMGPDPQH